jgi:uncharacterized membrane protein YfcA
MALTNIAGAYFGARLAIAKGSALVRVLFLVVVGGVICKLVWDFLKS